MAGGTGNDVYYVDSKKDGVIEKANEGSDTVISSIQSYTLVKAVETLQLLDGSGAISGTGYKADETITGNDGANTLNGKEGRDTLTGKAGADIFVFDTRLTTKKTANVVAAATNVDTITDFVSGTDRIYLSKRVFGKAVADTGDTDKSDGLFLNSTDIVSGDSLDAAKSNQGTAHFLYNAGTGALYYDADGSGTKFDATQFVALTGAVTLAASDLHIV
jgi:Ca2+-binding RTX toxin-like protein